MKKVFRFIKKNKSLILVTIAAVGVIGTAVSSASDSGRAEVAIDEVANERGELTTVEKVKIGWVYYIPTIVIGTITIACIATCHILNKREQTALLAAYASVSHYFSEYKKRVQEELGAEKEEQIRREVAEKVRQEMNLAKEDKKYTIIDSFTGKTFRDITLPQLYEADINTLREVSCWGWVPLETYYSNLGVNNQVADVLSNYKEELGFVINGNVAPFDVLYSSEDYLIDGNPVIRIEFNIDPMTYKEWEENWM